MLSIALFSLLSCKERVVHNESVQPKSKELSISPFVDTTDTQNIELIALLEKFLSSKNKTVASNEYWLASDFERYTYPFYDIYKVEDSKHGKDFYKPSLMEIIHIDDKQRLIKIAFIGLNPETGDRTIRCIYNLMAERMDSNWILKRALDYQTRDWKQVRHESITYHLPQDRMVNQAEMVKQAEDIELLCAFFETSPIHIDYYSCENPEQIFRIRGFDYNANMYANEKGGQAGYSDIIYSGNKSEVYTHEIVHIYTKNLFPRCNRFLDEGLATFIGGSVGKDYVWHKNKLREYVGENEINFEEHLEPYEKLLIDNQTSIPYMIGALICERTLRKYDKQALESMFEPEGEIWEQLNKVGLNKENINEELRAELALSPLPFAQL